MFRRFMIVCWTLFSIGLVVALGGFAGILYFDALSYPSRVSQGFAGYGIVLAGSMLLWNIIWYTAHWIWKGRSKTSASDGP